MHIPTPTTFLRTTLRSLAELVVLVALLWPWWRRLWLSRLSATFLALAIYAIVTVPLELTELEQIHHQWLVAADAILLLAIIATLATRLLHLVRPSRSGPAA